MQLMEICGMHIQSTKLPFHHIPKMLNWVVMTVTVGAILVQ